MKRFVSVWDMRRGQHKSSSSYMLTAFTLIEVMVAVLVITVVIAALLQMRGNSSHIFSELSKRVETDQYISFLISNSEYGFENKKTALDRLLSDFELERDLARELKSIKAEVIYQELELIDLDDGDTEASSGIVFKVGKTVLKAKESSAGLVRVRIK